MGEIEGGGSGIDVEEKKKRKKGKLASEEVSSETKKFIIRTEKAGGELNLWLP